MRSAEHSQIPKVLTIAGSDSSGGAGIQADLKTFTCLGVYGASVITALTAQNTIGVQGVHVPSVSFIQQQLESVLTDIDFQVVKTGMLPNPEVIKATADAIRQYNISTVVVDPVLVATSGDALVSGENATKSLMKDLFPLATLITPNIPEASAMTGKVIKTLSDMRQACVDLIATGCKNVLLKGGHFDFEQGESGEKYGDFVDPNVATDILYDGNEFQAFIRPRVESKNTHGTGCTLASAIAAELSKGRALNEAVETAKDYVHQGILNGLNIGSGHGPLNHMHALQVARRKEEKT